MQSFSSGTLLDEGSLAREAQRLAGALSFLGLEAGDRVAVKLGNVPEWVALRDAATALGLYLVPVNPKLTAPEVAHVIQASGARLLITEPGAPPGGVPTAVLSIESLRALGERMSPGPAKPEGAVGATLLFTSGTTGRPKGCLRSEAQEQARARELIRTYSLSHRDVHLIACPLAHSAPGIFLRAARAASARTVLLPKFDPREFLAAIQHYRATVFFLVPTQVQRLLALPHQERAAADLSSVRAVIVAGAPFSFEAKCKLIDWLGQGKLWEFYGSSETGTITVLPPSEQPAPDGCVGWPPPGVRLKLVGDDGSLVPRGNVGEIFVSSDTVMEGYLEGQGRTGGFVSVGDLGRLDDKGRLVLVDRKNDMIISGGLNVYPVEVERALTEHPDVSAAIACGVPDSDWGEKVVALVALKGGQETDELTLKEFLRQRLAPYKIPKHIVFVPHEELPLGGSGKPLRREARKQLERLSQE
ncbi:MAG: acyl--CoA ligase [Deltaproteobacteria bacterium]|nr:acyl--CoA ligase [Deltaproteobacteria bacterium]